MGNAHEDVGGELWSGHGKGGGEGEDGGGRAAAGLCPGAHGGWDRGHV